MCVCVCVCVFDLTCLDMLELITHCLTSRSQPLSLSLALVCMCVCVSLSLALVCVCVCVSQLGISVCVCVPLASVYLPSGGREIYICHLTPVPGLGLAGAESWLTHGGGCFSCRLSAHRHRALSVALPSHISQFNHTPITPLQLNYWCNAQ